MSKKPSGGKKEMVRREVIVPKEDWEFLMEYFRTKGFIPRPKIAEIFTGYVRELKRKDLESRKRELEKLEEDLKEEVEEEAE